MIGCTRSLPISPSRPGLATPPSPAARPSFRDLAAATVLRRAANSDSPKTLPFTRPTHSFSPSFFRPRLTPLD
jgi:hypothetical protein